MKVIPVVDVLNGIAVHAVKGRRQAYQPLKSILCNSAKPLEVSSTFETLGFKELYIADLDAIMRNGTNAFLLKEIAQQTGLKLMVDAGVKDLQGVTGVLENEASMAIIGTETLSDINVVKEAVKRFGSEKIVVSLDLINGEVLSASDQAKSLTATELARLIQDLGAGQLIVLDLARVGSGDGVNVSLVQEMRKGLGIKICVGGGVRGIEDLKMLNAIGVEGVLVASSLHSGRVSILELQREGFV